MGTNDTNEIWKPVVGFEGLYEVSNLGQVRSLDRQTRGGFKPSRILKPQTQWTGYTQVGLTRPGQRQQYKKIHVLVAEAFLPNPDNKPQMNHKNGIRNDNRLENLEWVTISENHKHAFRELGKKPSRAALGKPSPRRKLSKEQVEAIRSDTRSQTAIAEDYGVSQQTISNVKLGLFYTNW